MKLSSKELPAICVVGPFSPLNTTSLKITMRSISALAFFLAIWAGGANASDLPVVAGLKLGSRLGEDVALCEPGQPTLQRCSGKELDNWCEKSNELTLRTFQGIVPPADGSLCLGTEGGTRNGLAERTSHWVVNSRAKLQGLTISSVRAYRGRISAVVLRVDYFSGDSHSKTLQRLTDMLNASTGVQFRSIKQLNSCSGEGKNMECYFDVQREWELPEMRYFLKLGMTGGTLTAQAKFGEPPPVQFDPLITR